MIHIYIYICIYDLAHCCRRPAGRQRSGPSKAEWATAIGGGVGLSKQGGIIPTWYVESLRRKAYTKIGFKAKTKYKTQNRIGENKKLIEYLNIKQNRINGKPETKGLYEDWPQSQKK